MSGWPVLSAEASAARGVGSCVLIGLVAISFPNRLRGCIQRAMEGAIFGWMILTGVFLGLAHYA